MLSNAPWLGAGGFLKMETVRLTTRMAWRTTTRCWVTHFDQSITCWSPSSEPLHVLLQVQQAVHGQKRQSISSEREGQKSWGVSAVWSKCHLLLPRLWQVMREVLYTFRNQVHCSPQFWQGLQLFWQQKGKRKLNAAAPSGNQICWCVCLIMCPDQIYEVVVLIFIVCFLIFTPCAVPILLSFFLGNDSRSY